MELLLILLVLGVLLWIFGVPTQTLLLGVWILILALLAFMFLFFLGSAISLLFFRVRKGSFVRFDHHRKFAQAVYLVEDAEYINLFPAETVMQARLYHDRPHILLVRKSQYRNVAYDMHSVLIIALGTFSAIAMFGIFFAVLLLLLE